MNYQIYYMLTPRCILNCGYCFRDTSKESLTSELHVSKVKEVIYHLYHNFNVRKLTLSGGEPTVMGGVTNTDFLELIDYLRGFKSNVKEDNLRIELLSNAVNLTPDVTDKLIGVVDRITITLDSLDSKVLDFIGRNTVKYKNYINRFVDRFKDFYNKGFELKLHSVITPINYDSLVDLAKYIRSNPDFKVSKWKFYQYMTYGQPEKDLIYDIDDRRYNDICLKLTEVLKDSGIKYTFKDNKLMTDTMFNLLHNGRFEYYLNENGKRVRYLSDIILNYKDFNDFTTKCNVDLDMINTYHSYEV